MKILFKREQSRKSIGRVHFKLWAMLETDEVERALIEGYYIDQSVVIDGNDEGLWKRGAIVGLLAAIFAFLTINMFGIEAELAAPASLLVWFGAAYWWVNQKRETIFMKDLLHGRSFKCGSVIDLAKKEAWLENICQALMQVVESAKHWDGVEHRDIVVLPPEEAKAFIVRAFH